MRRLLVPLLVLVAAFPARPPGSPWRRRRQPRRPRRPREGAARRQGLADRAASATARSRSRSSSDGDGTEPVVRGYRTFKWGRNGKTRTYTGKSIRFRLIGGRYRVTFTGRGLHFSLVGRGPGPAGRQRLARGRDLLRRLLLAERQRGGVASRRADLDEPPAAAPAAPASFELAAASGILTAPCLLRRHSRC